ncbi:MAG: helix-turn-helix domain-containing protein [Sporomusaceae bacterium]|nr:helix-turn-helix domain-containing protein [Sporomusaceae bacterium]
MDSQQMVGRRIAALRREKGYTQENVSTVLKVTPQAVSKWEQGHALPDALLLPSLARLLGVSIDRLLTGADMLPQASPYDGAYQQPGYYWGMQPSELAEQVAGLLPDSRRRRLLDIGSGEGRDAVYFAKCGFTVDALEISPAGIAKINRYSEASGYAVNAVQADMIGYEPERGYDVVYSCGSLQFLPLPQRQRHFDKYKQQTKPEGLNAHLVFVDKPFIAVAPDWEPNEFFYQSGDLACYYRDWEILLCDEQIVDCQSAGIGHRHAVSRIIARKPAD